MGGYRPSTRRLEGGDVSIDVPELADRVGEEVGVGDWFEITQERIDAFAACTEDDQWIHRSGRQADDGPFGAPIAHGFLTLSLLSRLREGMTPLVESPRMMLNYGLDRVRFISPVVVGSRIRARSVLMEVTEVPGGVQIKQAITIELDGSDRPAAYVESLTRVLA
jgi:acyl dehydratase